MLNYIKGTLKQTFSKNVLNFSYRLLNISKLNIKDKKIEGLLTRPILYILKHIWRLDELKVRELFTLGQELSYEERGELVGRAADYMRKYDPNFSLNVAREIEAKTITDKEERIMTPLLQYSLDEAMAKGVKKGMLQARQKYLQEGMLAGMQKGKEEGKEEGRQENMRQVIANMFQENADIPFIMKVTGLSEAEIKKLQKQYSK